MKFHYIINKDKYPVNYSYSDTARDTNFKITGVTIHLYAADYKDDKPSTFTDNSGAYPVTTITNKGLAMCSDKLKAALSQKDADPSGKVYIDFWGISSDPKACAGDGFINKSLKRGDFYYQITLQKTLGDAAKYLAVHYRTWEIGLATIPFKYRFGRQKDTIHVPNDASANINAGFYIGHKWGASLFYADKSKSRNRVAYTAGIFFAPSVIPVSQDNAFPTTDTLLAKQLKNKANEFGISTGIAFMVAIKDLNIGLFYGTDFAISGISKQWYYANRPWIGFGIGYKISILGEK